MVHLAVSKNSKISLCEAIGKFNSEDYIHLFDEKILPILNTKFPAANYIWQQDNASIHVSKKTQNYFRINQVNTLKWPSRSPDLNIVENIFAFMSKHIYKDGK